jgi:energy-coupling factor transporter ATP-binding protein EcfA2
MVPLGGLTGSSSASTPGAVTAPPSSRESAGDTDVGFFRDNTLVMGPQRQTVAMPGAPGWSGAPDYLADAATEDEGDNLIAGTMGYIDPACLASGAAPDPSSDLYALGAMLYECLTACLPSSPARNSTEIKQSVALGIERPPPLRTLVPDVPEEVARLIDSLVDPDRARRPRHAEAVAAEIDRLRRGVGRSRVLPDEGPFRGLDAFDERHRDVFFGRSSELAIALETLRSRGLLALIGPSGSGKSSLARAGVLPAVVEGELGGWPHRYAPVMARPGRFPRMAIDVAFSQMFGRGVAGVDPSTFIATLGARVESTEVGIVLYIDALEELVTVAEPQERDWLAEVLAQLSRAPIPGVRVIVSARRDFLDGLLALPSFGPMLARSVQLIAPLTGRAFAEALQERLAVYGYALEDAAMFDELARELAAAPEAMPLFEFALARLWAERDQVHRRLGRAALARIGGIAGALEQHAESTLHALVTQYGPAVELATRNVLISLTTPSGTRTRRTVEEVANESRVDRRILDAIVAAFEQGRLIVVEEGKLTLAHETLLQRWPRLSAWVASVKRERELAEETERAAARWSERKQERSLLLRGRALRDARELERTPAVTLSPAARAFVKASRRAEARGVTGVIALLSSVLIGLGVLFGLYRLLEKDARQKERAAEQFASTLKKSQSTPEADRVKAIKALLEEKRACEKELEKRAACGPAPMVDAGADAAGGAHGGVTSRSD